MINDEMTLTLLISGSQYPITIDRKDEEAFRSAAKRLNNMINQYRATFGGEGSGLATKDYAIMAALQVLVDNFSLGKSNNTKPYEDKINLIISELDAYLKK